MDIIFLRGLKVDAVIGIWEWERRVRQTLSLDLEFAVDARKAASADSISNALDYHEVAQRLIAFAEASEFQLVETLAEALARIMITEFRVKWTRIGVSKPAALRGAHAVGVMIERRDGDFDA